MPDPRVRRVRRTRGWSGGRYSFTVTVTSIGVVVIESSA